MNETNKRLRIDKTLHEFFLGIVAATEGAPFTRERPTTWHMGWMHGHWMAANGVGVTPARFRAQCEAVENCTAWDAMAEAIDAAREDE